ncbi:hypothetical protein NDU88_006720 [Pleurodeles waltl]|uniref:Uncharacterized protein n=1 Tax=Pleurodeles waltl TaxID=8319 RepID=A0AAV7X0Z5_PLEWA|nr:hypothetical protein NDU88_006720 [Pleurodeles waltl]
MVDRGGPLSFGWRFSFAIDNSLFFRAMSFKELEDRREKITLNLELAKQDKKQALALAKLEKDQVLAKLENKQALAENRLAMEEKKMAHELSLRELDIGALQIRSYCSNGGNLPAVSDSESRGRSPKKLIPKPLLRGNIKKWLATDEATLTVHGVPEEHLGGNL